MEFLFIVSMEKTSEDKSIRHPVSFSILPLFSRKVVREAPVNFPQKKKVLINYVFCRNWAVRNPAVTRLDSSSLVKKQVDWDLPFLDKIHSPPSVTCHV